ncbi:hypothetical protein RS022_07370 [Candidatus Phytoplasma rubi]|uniref:Uncharacterized protein n=1 Tax=Candidatus Phytoplasma rubi TaxID=399025 RepID=A0ABY7BUB0_9MOLU|nr:hypothetical protein [Candidatus Phytoplasma rubi]WAN63562.1 hypothetical protein RS022_07370 [Candidatus Phytoplasma rubi]
MNSKEKSNYEKIREIILRFIKIKIVSKNNSIFPTLNSEQEAIDFFLNFFIFLDNFKN